MCLQKEPTMQNPETPSLGHFDRRVVLEPLLENYSPPQAEAVQLDEYVQWPAAKRREFDARRFNRIANGVIVGLPQLIDLRKEVRRASLFADRNVGRTSVILSGPPTAGKTTTAFHAMADAFARHAIRFPDWKQHGHIPVVYIEVPPGTTAKAIMGRIIDFLGLPLQSRMTLEERTKLVLFHLQRGHTSLIVIDEMQNLARLTGGSFETAQAVKNLMNGLRAVPLYVGVKLEETALTNGDLGAQFASRSSMVRLGPLPYNTAADRELWKGVIHRFEEQFALLDHPPTTLFPDADYLWQRTRGSMGALSRLLTTAALELIEEGKPRDERLTRKLLDSIPLDLTTERALDAAAPRGRGRRRAA